MATPPIAAEPLKIFYSYAHEDERLRKQLEKHLALLRNQGVISEWHDRQIPASSEWASHIDDALNTADIILLLVSADFLASRYCYGIEMERALERHESGEAMVIPIILRDVDWQMAPFRKLQSLPRDGRPVTKFTDRDSAWRQVAEGIRHATAELGRARPSRPAPARPASTPSAPATEEPFPVKFPTPTTKLIGRDRELRQALDYQRSDTVKLTTLIGPGGVGKTRLALQIASELAEDFADGVAYVSLEQVAEPEDVAPTIANRLGLGEIGSQSVDDILVGYLHAKDLLLVLDNFEHVMPARSLLGELLARCADLKLVVTSRVLLDLPGEHRIDVQPLTAPRVERGDEDQLASPAVQLFIERARASQAHFELSEKDARIVAEICHRLDGLPLAIELAAARVRTDTLEEILEETDHQTLADTIERSYSLLAPEEQRLFRELSIFAGGWTRDAAGAVSGDLKGTRERLRSLMDHSLVRRDDRPGAQSRYVMLDTIRDYAVGQRRNVDDDAELRRRHAAYYLRLAEEAAEYLTGADQIEWLDQLDMEHDNLRAALSWAIEDEDAELGLRLGAALWLFWSGRGYLTSGRKHLADVLKIPGASDAPLLRARVLAGGGWLAQEQDEFRRAISLSQQALKLYRAADDEDEQAGMTVPLLCLGMVALKEDELDQAAEYLTESEEVARAARDNWALTQAVLYQGLAELKRGNMDEAKTLLNRSVGLARRQGDRFSRVRALGNLGRIALAEQEFGAAETYYNETLDVTEELRERRLRSIVLSHCGYLAHDRGDFKQALGFYRECLTLCQELGNTLTAVQSLEEVGAAWVRMDQADRTARLLGAADGLRDFYGYTRSEIEEQEHAAIVQEAREKLGAQTFDAHWTIGQHMTLDEAIEFVRE
jgi:predicted ATPase